MANMKRTSLVGAKRRTLQTALAAFLTAISTTALAGESGYICEIKEVRVLSDNGTTINSDEHSEQYEERNFSINRQNGEMIGMPFTTSNFKDITVLDHGGESASYKAMATATEPTLSAMYIYVAEHFDGRDKPFWGTANGTQIYSGLCE